MPVYGYGLVFLVAEGKDALKKIVSSEEQCQIPLETDS